LPSEPQRSKEGQLIKGSNGKPLYRSALKWRSRELQDQFSRQLIELIVRQHGSMSKDGER
jgi:hypothetical protein